MKHKEIEERKVAVVGTNDGRQIVAKLDCSGKRCRNKNYHQDIPKKKT